jgi:hypothetical protein
MTHFVKKYMLFNTFFIYSQYINNNKIIESIIATVICNALIF